MTERRSRGKIIRRAAIAVLILAIGGIILMRTPVGGWLSGNVHFGGMSMWQGGDQVGSLWHGFINGFKDRQALAQENQELKREIEEMSAKLLDRNRLWEENIELRTMLGRTPAQDIRVTGHVLAGPGRTAYDTLTIDVGRDSGLRSGNLVFYGSNDNNVVIGRVTESHPRSAVVTLFSAPGETLDVLIGEERIPAQAQGRGGGNFAIKVPRDVSVSKGDTIRVSGRHARIAGTVGHIAVNPNDPFKTILFKSPVNVFDIEWVQVLKSET